MYNYICIVFLYMMQWVIKNFLYIKTYLLFAAKGVVVH